MAPVTRHSGTSKKKPASSLWERLTSLPFLALTTAITVGITWLVTQGLAQVERKRDLKQPVSVSIEWNPALVSAFSDDTIFMTLKPSAQIAPDPGPGCRTFYPKLIADGAVAAGVTHLQVIVQGATSAAVLISDMRAVVTKRSEPRKGVVATCPSAGAAQIRSVNIDLDRQDPVAVLKSPQSKFGFTVEEGETETFLVSATTKSCYCEWHLELELVVDGKRQMVEVQRGEEPFATTAYSKSAPMIAWDYERSWFDGARHIRPGEPLPR